MNPGVSHRNRIGSSNASHSCMNRAALSAPSASIAPPRWLGSLAITPSGLPSTRASAVTIPCPNPRRSSSTSSSSASITFADVVDALAVGRDQVAQRGLIALGRAGSVGPRK